MNSCWCMLKGNKSYPNPVEHSKHRCIWKEDVECCSGACDDCDVFFGIGDSDKSIR